MINAQDLAAWRPYAPWSSDLMVEQDFLLCKAVAAIFEDTFLRQQVAMRGGTVLHKGHLAPSSRYSEDIDLVLVGDRPPAHIKRALHRVLKPLLSEPTESVFTEIQLAVRHLFAKSSILRTTYIYDPSSHEAAFAQLKVEVNTNENRSLFPLVDTAITVPDAGGAVRQVTVRSYDLDEMLGTALRALLQREQGRDLFDLWWAWEMSKRPATATKVNPVRVGETFRFYMNEEGSHFAAAEIRRELERRMTSHKFLSDMNSYLRLGNTYSPRQACDEFFEVFLPHIDV